MSDLDTIVQVNRQATERGVSTYERGEHILNTLASLNPGQFDSAADYYRARRRLTQTYHDLLRLRPPTVLREVA